MEYADGIGNYLYILLAVGYMIYSFVKAGQKHKKNRPGKTSTPNPEPAVDTDDDPLEGWKKILEEARTASQKEQKAKPVPQTVAKPVPEGTRTPPQRGRLIKPKTDPVLPHVSKAGKTSAPEHVLVAEHMPAAEFITHPEVLKAAFERSEERDQQVPIEWDLRKAVIYSEILKRPEW